MTMTGACVLVWIVAALLFVRKWAWRLIGRGWKPIATVNGFPVVSVDEYLTVAGESVVWCRVALGGRVAPMAVDVREIVVTA